MDESKIKLGKKYRDELSGIEGIAISKHEYIHGCTRIALQWVKDGELKSEVFDSPGLVDVAVEEKVTTRKTGGPRPVPAPRSVG